VTTSRGLSRLSLPDLRALHGALERGGLGVPVTATGLSALGLGRDAEELAALLGPLGREGVRVALQVAIAERIHRQAPHLELVWTGPESRDSVARDTAIVVRQLFAGARRRVLVGGFSFDHGEDIFRPLYEVMVQHGVQATFFLDIEGHASEVAGAEAHAAAQIDRFFADDWPFGHPRPDVYYDPRTAVPGPPWASLHAKCVVVDAQRALVSSANFTMQGQEKNVEVGILLDDPAFARNIGQQWMSLVHENLVRPWPGRRLEKA